MMFKEFKQSLCWNESLPKCLHKGVLSFIRYSRDYGIHQLECWHAGSTLYHLAGTVILAAITMVKISCRHTCNDTYILIKSILITINKCLGGQVLQSITFLWPFGKNLVDKFNPQ